MKWCKNGLCLRHGAPTGGNHAFRRNGRGNRHHAGNHHHLHPGCGGAHPLYAPGYGGHDDQRKLGVRLAGEDNFLYGRPGTSHHLRLQRRRSDDDANHSLRSHVRHAQRAGRNGPGRIRHGTAAYHLFPRLGCRRRSDLHESRLRGNGNRTAAQRRQRCRGNSAHGPAQHHRGSHLHEEHL